MTPPQPATSAAAMAYTPTSWTLEFQGHPPSPNARMHFMTRAKHNKHWRYLAAIAAYGQNIPKLARVKLTPIVIRPRLGVADPSNDASRFKAIEDGLVDAGVVPKDTYRYVQWAAVTEERGPRGCRVIVEAIG